MTRTATAQPTARLQLGNITLDRATFELSGPGGAVRLAGREFQVMELLLRNPRTKGLTARLPVRPGEPGAKPFGMVKWLTMRRWNLDHAYLGLALD